MNGMLVTIGLKACNQREFIGAAVRAALAQTYRPLEIVISDDGSTDGTWDEIKKTVADAAIAPDLRSRLVLNRNEANLGNMGNWLRIGALSHGEWIVKFDGDDISEPTRVEEMVRAIQAAEGCRPTVATCGGTKIDSSGRVVGHFAARSARYPLGACMAFHRDCFAVFPRPENGRIVDDEVFARRALMLGGEVRVERPLVRYRIGNGISSDCRDVRATELRCMRQFSETLRQCRVDLEAVRARIGDVACEQWTARLDYEAAQHRASVALREAATFGERWRAYREVEKSPFWTPYRWKLLLYLLPKKQGDWLIGLMTRLRYGV